MPTSRRMIRSFRAVGEMAINGDDGLRHFAPASGCDTVGGLNAAFAVMAALFHRQRTGEGQ